MRTRKQKGNRGFTLIEVMIASFIFIMILGVILNIYLSGSEMYENNKLQADLQAQARLALNAMVAELSNATKTTLPLGQSPPNLLIPAAPGNDNMTFYLPVYVIDAITLKPRVNINATGLIQWDNTPINYQHNANQRTLVRVSNAAQTVLARDVSSVQFANVSNYEIRVTLTLSKATPTKRRNITITLSSVIRLRN